LDSVDENSSVSSDVSDEDTIAMVIESMFIFYSPYSDKGEDPFPLIYATGQRDSLEAYFGFLGASLEAPIQLMAFYTIFLENRMPLNLFTSVFRAFRSPLFGASIPNINPRKMLSHTPHILSHNRVILKLYLFKSPCFRSSLICIKHIVKLMDVKFRFFLHLIG